jgi:hypothetical protein
MRKSPLLFLRTPTPITLAEYCTPSGRIHELLCSGRFSKDPPALLHIQPTPRYVLSTNMVPIMGDSPRLLANRGQEYQRYNAQMGMRS